MLVRRTASRRDWSQIDQLIHHLEMDEDLYDSQWVSNHMDNPHLHPYFTNLHLHISGRNLHHCPGYETLNDGIYILLKGQVRIALGDIMTDKQKMKKSKISNFKLISSASTINQSWSVFQSTFKNCTALSETYLLKVSQEEAIQSKFYELFNSRNSLYLNHFLSQDHQRLFQYAQDDRVINVDIKIHSNFSFKTYYFRQQISLEVPAIVSRGRARIIIDGVRTHEFAQCGLLLPKLKYQVLSSELELMIIRSNETLSYRFQFPSPKVTPKIITQIKSSISLYKSNYPSLHKSTSTECFSAKNKNRQKQTNIKDIIKISKQSQPYSIISSFLCEKNLKFAKKHNFIHNTKKKKQSRYFHPLILFDISNQRSKLDTPTFQKAQNRSNNNLKPKNTNSLKSLSQNCNKQGIFPRTKFPYPQHSKLIQRYIQNSTQIFEKKKITQKFERYPNEKKVNRTVHLSRQTCEIQQN